MSHTTYCPCAHLCATANEPCCTCGKFVAPEPALSVAEAGRRGGEATLAKRGREFLAEIGRKGGIETQRRNAEAQRIADEAKAGKHGNPG